MNNLFACLQFCNKGITNNAFTSMYQRPFFVYKMKIPQKWHIPLKFESYHIMSKCLINFIFTAASQEDFILLPGLQVGYFCIPWIVALKGRLNYIFEFFTMDINSREYCKTYHVCRMWNFNLEMTRFPENVTRFS